VKAVVNTDTSMTKSANLDEFLSEVVPRLKLLHVLLKDVVCRSLKSCSFGAISMGTLQEQGI